MTAGGRGGPRLGELVRRHLAPDAVTGLGPALAAAAELGLDPILLSPAFVDRPGLLVLTSVELRYVTADASDVASAPLQGIATAEVTTYEGRSVMVLIAADSRRSMFHLGDAPWTRSFADVVNLALDDPGAAVVAADRLGGTAPPASTATAPPPSAGAGRPTRDRLLELEALRRDGLLTEAEYAAQRAAIIGSV